jgi:hypothetical protein
MGGTSEQSGLGRLEVEMQDSMADANHELMVDGNAVAGMLYDVFGVEMTAAPTECASCGNEGAMGTLLAFTEGPGIVLRCPACENVVLRIVETPEALILDARGAVYLQLARSRQ